MPSGAVVKLSLQNLRKEYLNLKEVLLMDLTNWDPRTRSGMEGKKNEAKTRIENVKNQLAAAILNNSSITVILRDYEFTGKVVEAAKSDAKKNAVVDYLSLEKSMYKSIFGDKDGSTSFNTHTLNRMNIFMSEVGEKLGVLSMPTITTTSDKYGTLKRQDMIERMEEVSTQAYGYEFKTLSLRALVFDRIMDRIDQDGVNIVLVNVPEGFVSIARQLAGQSTVLDGEAGEFKLEAPKASKTRRVKPTAAVDDTQS